MSSQNIKKTAYSHLFDRSKFMLLELVHLQKNKNYQSNQLPFYKLFWFSEHSKKGFKKKRLNKIRLVPPLEALDRSLIFENGVVIAFEREYLLEDDKEFSLDVFNLFNAEVQNQEITIPKAVEENLNYILHLIRFEVRNKFGSFLILKPLVKVFLLQIIRLSRKKFIEQDVQQKRIYQFFILLEKHYIEERKASFYAKQLDISTKRLNQILKEKVKTTVTQLIHNRLLLEAKRELTKSELTIKEISFHLQFKDHSYFSRFFKKQSGVTPEEYTKRNCIG